MKTDMNNGTPESDLLERTTLNPADWMLLARKLERELAATTDVLSALQNIVALSDKQDFWLPKNWLDCAKTAIAKAEGGTQ